MLLDHRHDDVPELWGLLEVVLADEVETEHDLLRSHGLFAIPLIDVHDISGVLGVHEIEVALIKFPADHILEIVVAACMDAPSGHCRKHAHR